VRIAARRHHRGVLIEAALLRCGNESLQAPGEVVVAAEGSDEALERNQILGAFL
jgi:hypothetical protein